MKKALIGDGGHAREVMCQMGQKIPCFVDDEFLTNNSLPLSLLDINKYIVLVAIADPIDRANIVNKLPKNTKFFTFIHPTAIIMDKSTTTIGIGSFIGAYSVITTDINIGNHCILNRSVQIGHDTNIGDYFSAMPGSIVSGNCTIGNYVYLGTNASIKQSKTICDKVIIGLNSGIVDNIISPGVYGGVPAKLIR